MKIVILERNSVGTDIDVSCLGELGEVEAYPVSVLENAAERIADADIIINNKVPLNEQTLKNAPNVKLICEFATGYDNVDIEYCRQRHIKVANVVNYSTDAVAQHTFAMVFYLLGHLRHYDDYVKSGAYGAQPRFSNFDLVFTELKGKTWGIIGMGNIGRKVAHIAETFGCHVLFHSVTGTSKCTDYTQVSFDTLLQESDILSLHCPLSDMTRNLIDMEALKKMKKTAILINVARGPVVDENALYEALEADMIAAAGLDVLSKEPIAPDNPLGKIMDSNKLLITPHLAWASKEARQRVVEETYKNIEAFLKGENRNVVNL